jgi:glycine cleavage system T protein
MAKQSPLMAFHKANGAVFNDYDGWLLPIHFGDSSAEYEAVRCAIGLMDLSHRGLLQFTGPDRLSFLQGMVSNDLRTLNPGHALYATVLNVQGKVLSDCRILCTEDAFLLDLWESLKKKIIDHLNRFLVADEVEIGDLSDTVGLFSIQGPQSDVFLQQILGQKLTLENPNQYSIAALDGCEVRVLRYSHTGEKGFDLFVPSDAFVRIGQFLNEAGKTFSARWIGHQAQELLRVEAGIPRYGIDFTEEHLLLETGLAHAVSFVKGCYLGQEIIERIRSRGHVNRKLMGLLLEGEDAASTGDVIFSGEKEVGRVTSSIYSPALKRPIALGYLHRDHWDVGSKLSIRPNKLTIPLTVTELPFLSR